MAGLMDNDDDEDLEPDEAARAIGEQLHQAYWDGHAAGVAAEKKRRNDKARRNRQLRKTQSHRQT
ncbi:MULTISPECIES: hypothetical protein [Mycolicibacterium]|uniref:hypothetical protein n=1 Tax=Mycolicibacterium TaxID=1866885 RepID=UPI001CDCBF29|nr:hypothetical protein [Mycolicibacterium fortuitum]UBV20326.1 hypothetical protein H8Z59_24085 [Mycolicibacterium fortuitum]